MYAGHIVSRPRFSQPSVNEPHCPCVKPGDSPRGECIIVAGCRKNADQYGKANPKMICETGSCAGKCIGSSYLVLRLLAAC